MFRRGKSGPTGRPVNRLSNQVEPNTLDWAVAEPADSPGAEGVDDNDMELEPDGPSSESVDVDEADTDLRAARLQAELQREADEFGLTTDDPEKKYGPRGDEVASILAALADLDDEKAVALADEYEAVPKDQFRAAHSAVDRVRGSGLEPELWAAEHAISDWLASLKLAGEVETYSIAADIATDAVDALILRDLLSDKEFDTLHDPWCRVMGTGGEAAATGRAQAPEPAAAPEPGAAHGDSAEGGPEGEFGPNSDLVLQFLERLDALTSAEIVVLIAAWGRQPRDAIRSAHANLQTIADEDPAWHEQIRRAQEEVARWAIGSRERQYTGDASLVGAAVREPAGPAAADAIAALVMADVLEREDSETLYAPWAEVIGWPAFPTYETDDTD